jgi:hypothetical protein
MIENMKHHQAVKNDVEPRGKPQTARRSKGKRPRKKRRIAREEEEDEEEEEEEEEEQGKEEKEAETRPLTLRQCAKFGRALATTWHRGIEST